MSPKSPKSLESQVSPATPTPATVRIRPPRQNNEAPVGGTPGMPIINDPATYVIIGAAMEVHRELGPGFLEAAYQRALGMEFRRRGVAFEEQVQIPLFYKGESLGVPWKADVVVGDVVVELKALPTVGAAERRQVVHYLKGTGRRLGLLINFGAASLQFERIVGNSANESTQSNSSATSAPCGA